MQRLRELCLLGESPILGLTIHQSKGLEWDRVLLLNGELNTNPGWRNRLEQKWEDHRSVYVGLTRARSKLRVIPVGQSSSRPAPRSYGFRPRSGDAHPTGARLAGGFLEGRVTYELMADVWPTATRTLPPQRRSSSSSGSGRACPRSSTRAP